MHVYKCLNGLINHELTLVTQHLHNYNTRNKVNLRLLCVERNWGKQRTAYHAVNDFNSLSEMIRDSTNAGEIFLNDRLKNHTLWDGTYLYSPYKGVPPGFSINMKDGKNYS